MLVYDSGESWRQKITPRCITGQTGESATGVGLSVL
jgi:hypothetical protein